MQSLVNSPLSSLSLLRRSLLLLLLSLSLPSSLSSFLVVRPPPPLVVGLVSRAARGGGSTQLGVNADAASPDADRCPWRKPFVAGNWKMNPASKAEALELAKGVCSMMTPSTPYCDVCIFVPSLYLDAVSQVISSFPPSPPPLQLGAQNAGRHYPHTTGAFTGSISPAMLHSLSTVRWCLAGHSERRTLFHESDSVVNSQLKGIFSLPSSPPSVPPLGAVLCVGESLSSRRSGLWSTVLLSQLSTCLDGIPVLDLPNLVIAYEPVWAIGTGVPCKPADAAAAHYVIRGFVSRKYGHEAGERIRIIYGGSVSPDNVDNIMDAQDGDGVLVGGASLDVEKFRRILQFKRKPKEE